MKAVWKWTREGKCGTEQEKKNQIVLKLQK